MSDLHYTIVDLPDHAFYSPKTAKLREEFEDLFGRKPDDADEKLGLEELIHVARFFEARGWA